MTLEAFVELEAERIPRGGSRRFVCPACGGGSTRERSFAIWRTPTGEVGYKCHRASCGIGDRMFTLPSLSPYAHLPPDNAYRGEFRPIDEIDQRYFKERFELDVPINGPIGVTENAEYVLKVLDRDSRTTGYNVRKKPWSGEPAYPRRNTQAAGEGKSKLYMNNADYPRLSVHRPQAPYAYTPTGGTFVIVEDQISAMKAAQAGVTGIALLGVGLDITKVRYIQQMAPHEVVFALDADASKTAFKLAREYGLAFPKVRVVLLARDLKDEPASDISAILQLQP